MVAHVGWKPALTAALGKVGETLAVEQVALTANLAYTLPAGTPANTVHHVTFTQTTGGHTVTYDDLPLTLDLAAGASTTVELVPVGGGYVIRYPLAPTAAGLAVVNATTAAAQRAAMGVSTPQRSEVDARRSRGAITFTWDDGIDTIYTTLFPLLRDSFPNQRHTFALVTDNIGTTGKLTAAMIQEMSAAGHEFGSHSKSHPRMTNVVLAADRVTQYDVSKAAIEAIIGKPITTWVYPYGQSARSITTDSEVLSRYERLVSSDFKTGIVPLSEREHVIAVPRHPDWTTATHSLVLDLIRLAARQPVIVNIMGHSPGFHMTPAELLEGLALADSLGVPVLSAAEAYPGGSLLTNGSAESGTVGWIKAGEVFESVTATPADGIAGTKVFRLTSTADTNTTFAHQTVPVIPGETYTLSGRVKTNVSSGPGAHFRIQPYKHGDTVTAAARTAGSYKLSATWEPLSLTLTAPADCATMRLDMAIETSTGEAWFDNLRFNVSRYGALG